MFTGIGTVVNVATVLLGSVIGVLVGHRLSQRTRDVVTDALGLVTLLIAASSATSVATRRSAACWARTRWRRSWEYALEIPVANNSAKSASRLSVSAGMVVA